MIKCFIIELMQYILYESLKLNSHNKMFNSADLTDTKLSGFVPNNILKPCSVGFVNMEYIDQG